MTDIADQTRCLKCLGPVYDRYVHDFSRGVTACRWCRHYATIMTPGEYWKALTAARGESRRRTARVPVLPTP